MNRLQRRAEYFKKRTKEEIRGGIFPERIMIRGYQDHSRTTHKVLWMETSHKSKSGVVYKTYKSLMIKV